MVHQKKAILKTTKPITLEMLQERISAFCSNQPKILALYLFGSAAKGSFKQGSDLDVAILLDKHQSEDFFLLDFIIHMEKISGLTVDAVVLHRAGEVLKHQIRKTGRLIFDRSPAYRKRFEVLGRKSYEDFLYLHRRYVNRILYGGQNG